MHSFKEALFFKFVYFFSFFFFFHFSFFSYAKKEPYEIEKNGVYFDQILQSFKRTNFKSPILFIERGVQKVRGLIFLKRADGAQAKRGKEKEIELTIYSSRKEHLIRPIFKKYEKESNQKGNSSQRKVKIKYLTGESYALLQKLKIEEKYNPVDLLITVDAGSLGFAKEQGLLEPVSSPILKKNIPSYLRESKNYWFAVSLRTRPIFYNPKFVNPKELSTYENLGDSYWKGKLCLRTSKKVYTQFLVSSMILHLGKKRVKEILQNWVKNLATKVFFSDTKLLKAIDAGQCWVGIANTYYYARLLKDNPQIRVQLFWPNQKERGVHINISGIALAKTSKNQKEAKKFMEWLSQEEAQKMFADLNMEYPVNQNTKLHSIVHSFGSFKKDTLSLEKIGEMQKESIFLMDQVKYN